MRCIVLCACTPPSTSFVVVSGKDVDGRREPVLGRTGACPCEGAAKAGGPTRGPAMTEWSRNQRDLA
jgi:hypothetical protein